jgi:hypothetical protein
MAASCQLQERNGELVVTGSGFADSVPLQYEVFAEAGNVAGGEIFSDAHGGIQADIGSLQFFSTVYAGEHTLTLRIYPIKGDKAILRTVLAESKLSL